MLLFKGGRPLATKKATIRIWAHVQQFDDGVPLFKGCATIRVTQVVCLHQVHWPVWTE